jgi:hypothetical protein
VCTQVLIKENVISIELEGERARREREILCDTQSELCISHKIPPRPDAQFPPWLVEMTIGFKYLKLVDTQPRGVRGMNLKKIVLLF